MDFTISRSWYKGADVSPSPENSTVGRKGKGKKATDASTIARNSPVPTRFQPNIQNLETIASQIEHDQEEENDDIDTPSSISSIKTTQRSDDRDTKVDQKLPLEKSFHQSMNGYSPPKRSRWADVFESKPFDRRMMPANFVTSALRKKSPTTFFGISGRKASPSSPLANSPRALPPTSKSSSLISSKVPIRAKSPPKKKANSSDDSQRFRALLVRSDDAAPLFVSATGTHQQFFSSGGPARPLPSNNSQVLKTSRPPNASRSSNNSRPSNASHSSKNSRSSIARGSVNNSQASRLSRSTNATMDTSRNSSAGGTAWSLMNGSISSGSQLTDHTRMTSISGSFSYQPSISESQMILPGVFTANSQPEMMSFDQASPEILSLPATTFNHDMALSTTALRPPTAAIAMASAPIVLAATPMVMVPVSMVMSNLTPVPDLSHLVKKFRPTNMLLREQGMIPDNSRNDTNYEGDENHPDLLNLPDSVNCCMWIINIPPDVQPGEFMRILDCGAVAALSMVPPQKGHITQAAKATFKKVSAGAELHRRARHKSGLRIRRNKIKVWYNDYGAYEWRGPETRFLEIEAPAVLDENFWLSYFNNWCKNIIISINPLPCRKYGFDCRRFEFVRIAGQAQTCYQAIVKDEAFMGQVTVQYGIDHDDK